MHADQVPAADFPAGGLVPKRETGVANLHTLYPEFDGRGVTIAVFDSALDPAAPGLQRTSDGRPKVIDLIDATGAGDVDTSHVAQLQDGSLTALSGRQLRIPAGWECPSGKFHVGMKPLYELYPEKLRKRIQSEYKEKEWVKHQATAVAEALKKQQEHEQAHPNPTGLDKQDREDLDARLEALAAADKAFKDAGPVLDCVVFHDGSTWRVCVDTSLTGNLGQCQLLGNYRETLQHGYLSRRCMMAFGVNVYSDGNLLSIVTPSSSHGTHVSAIAAACFPDDPDKNGMAPGAQLVSINIGDGRVGTMETGTAIVRAVAHLMTCRDKYTVDLINMSYGEHARWSDSGRLGELANELVNKHGVIWCASAGNAGPALNTIGAPPNLPGSQPGTILGIGAYVTPPMMEACYGMRECVPTMPYTWTSRDPSGSSAGRYITVCAPGCAITSVPNYTLQGCEQMNGTSMASPNATGSIATLLSCLKGLGMEYSVYSVRRAIKATAVPLTSPGADPFAAGSGMLRVDKALEHLKQYHSSQDKDVTFVATVAPNDLHGIYLRDGGIDVRHKIVEKAVSVRTQFINQDAADPVKQISFALRCVLTCDASWVQVAKYVHHMNSTRNFAIKVDARSLPEGVHATSVRAFDAAQPERGALFELPVTVVVPILLDPTDPTLERTLSLQPGQLERIFVRVPDAASSAAVTLRSLEREKDHRFVIHAMQSVPHMSSKSCEYYKMANLAPGCSHHETFKIEGGHVLEVVVCKYWTSLGAADVRLTLALDGLRPSAPVLAMTAAEVLRLEVSNALRSTEMAAPQVLLKGQVCSYRPTSAKVSPLSDDRDTLPDGRVIYGLTLTYGINVLKAGDITPDFQFLSDTLYESEFESQMWMLFDANKQYVAAGDAYPSKYSVRVEKGEYTLMLRIRHEKRELLEKLTDLSLQVTFKLPSELKLDTHYRYNDALTGSRRASTAQLRPGLRLPVYIAPLALSNNRTSKLSLSAGQLLVGHLTLQPTRGGYDKAVRARPRPGRQGPQPGQFPFRYFIPDVARKTSSKPEKEKVSKQEEFQTALKDFKIMWLGKLGSGGGDAASNLLDELLVGERLDRICANSAKLQTLDTTLEKDAAEVVRRADAVLADVDRVRLLTYYGRKNAAAEDAAVKSDMERERAAMLDALSRKGVVLCECMERKKPADVFAMATLANVQDLMNSALEFAEPTELKLLPFSVRHALANSRYGLALRYQQRLTDDKPTAENEQKLVDIYERLGWRHLAAHLQRSRAVRFPADYRPM
ncbi:tripeptidyl-peptidase 2-like [Pollicipes pollicipes]|uniref:tripeptidyl-peptidase 2-like n=1 Tax=Pollicipes pollicipes TaxID=41117 RepID=UPI0018850FDD|nr:tripeptidyl-peptidase 2-like [Pollicipes pollicipes]